jgi:hypothetical protein
VVHQDPRALGLETFRGFFEKIVEMCFEAGSVRGEELVFDSAKVKPP